MRDAAERFLELLNSDPAEAAKRYDLLRRRLLFWFRNNGASDPENLADETLCRAYRKLHEGLELQSDKLTAYCFGVAQYVLTDHRRRKSTGEQQPPEGLDPGREEFHQVEARLVLTQCLESLSGEDRDLIVTYHMGDRKALARREGLTETALRVRISRIKKKLEDKCGPFSTRR